MILGFRLTIRNVNVGIVNIGFRSTERFRLTIRNVNKFSFLTYLYRSDGFRLTIRNVNMNLQKKNEREQKVLD